RYTIEAHLVRGEASEAPARRPLPGPAREPAPNLSYDQRAVAMPARHAEDALRDRTELGSLFQSNSQDPLNYMNDAVDADLGRSPDPMAYGNGHDNADLAAQIIDPLAALSDEGQSPRQDAYPPPSPERGNRQSRPAPHAAPAGAPLGSPIGPNDPLRG